MIVMVAIESKITATRKLSLLGHILAVHSLPTATHLCRAGMCSLLATHGAFAMKAVPPGETENVGDGGGGWLHTNEAPPAAPLLAKAFCAGADALTSLNRYTRTGHPINTPNLVERVLTFKATILSTSSLPLRTQLFALKGRKAFGCPHLRQG